VCGEIVARLKPHASRVRTLTWDNGKDMVEHPRIAAGRNAQVYFAHLYAARERDTTENPFGLLVSTFLSSAT
jgi:transposase, IS30 family